MSSDGSYVVGASDATNLVILRQNGNTTIGGNVDVGPSQAQIEITTHFHDTKARVFYGNAREN